MDTLLNLTRHLLITSDDKRFSHTIIRPHFCIPVLTKSVSRTIVQIFSEEGLESAYVDVLSWSPCSPVEKIDTALRLLLKEYADSTHVPGDPGKSTDLKGVKAIHPRGAQSGRVPIVLLEAIPSDISPYVRLNYYRQVVRERKEHILVKALYVVARRDCEVSLAPTTSDAYSKSWSTMGRRETI